MQGVMDSISVKNFAKLPVYQFFNKFSFNAWILYPFQILLILVSVTAYSQNARIDSLIKLNASASGVDKADVLYELAYEFIDVDNIQAVEFSTESRLYSARIGDSLRIVRACRLQSSAYRRLEILDSAISTAKFGLDIAVRNGFRDEVKILLNSVAITHSLKAEYDVALAYHFESLIIREEIGTQSEVSVTLNNIGFIYFKLKNYQKALEYFERALNIKREIKDVYGLDRLLINLGVCNIHLKDFARALNSIKEGLKVCEENCGSDILIEGESGLGVAYYYLDDLDESHRHFTQSLNFATDNDNKRFQAENLVYLARIELRRENLKQAETHLLRGEDIVTSLGYNQLVLDFYKEFSNLYSLQREFEKASIYQKRYINLKDSLIGEELIKNIAKTQTQFEERENLRTIELKDEALARQRMLNLAIGTIAFLAALLVFVLYHNNKVRRRVNAKLSITNSKLAEANATIEAQNKELQSYNDKLEAEVKKATADLLVANTSLEKVNKELDNFIYKTSHDIRGPLASLKGMCNVALMDVKDQLALGYLQKLDETATKLNRILTRLLIINQINSAAIHPEPLDMDKVVDDIILLESKKGLPKGFQFKRDIQRNMIFRSDDALIRIILENLIDNAIKFHNDSARVIPFAHIKIFMEGPHMHIHVIDNGVGIALENPDKIFQMFTRASEKSGTGGLGLYLIKQAVSRLGGDVGLQLTSEGFTEFYATLPLEIPKELTEASQEQENEETKASA